MSNPSRTRLLHKACHNRIASHDYAWIVLDPPSIRVLTRCACAHACAWARVCTYEPLPNFRC
jgi:hypothetical protein